MTVKEFVTSSKSELYMHWEDEDDDEDDDVWVSWKLWILRLFQTHGSHCMASWENQEKPVKTLGKDWCEMNSLWCKKLQTNNNRRLCEDPFENGWKCVITQRNAFFTDSKWKAWMGLRQMTVWCSGKRLLTCKFAGQTCKFPVSVVWATRRRWDKHVITQPGSSFSQHFQN